MLTAVLVDGNFYLHRAKALWGKKGPAERAAELYRYVVGHLGRRSPTSPVEGGARTLYRLFYYDCPPLSHGSVYRPWDGKTTAFGPSNASFRWSNEFHRELARKRKVAMRMGTIMAGNPCYSLKSEALKAVIRGERAVADLGEGDFVLMGIKQAGVDMRIGLDVASLSQDRIVNQIVLVAGDMDFEPVAKVARRAGVDFILDPMGHHIRDELVVNTDGIEDLSGTFEAESEEEPK